jgi:putative flippase GtrA
LVAGLENSAQRVERAKGPAMKFLGPARPVVDYLENAWRERAVLLKAVSFGLVGLVNMSVDIVFFSLGCAIVVLLGYASSIHGVDGLPLIAVNTASWCIAVSGSYVMNSMFTFAHETGRKLAWRSYAAFISSGLFGLVVSTAVLMLAKNHMSLWAAKGCAILAGFIVNFSMSHFVVFRQRPRSSDIA